LGSDWGSGVPIGVRGSRLRSLGVQKYPPFSVFFEERVTRIRIPVRGPSLFQNPHFFGGFYGERFCFAFGAKQGFYGSSKKDGFGGRSVIDFPLSAVLIWFLWGANSEGGEKPYFSTEKVAFWGVGPGQGDLSKTRSDVGGFVGF
jgi:hypothetical protein